MLKRRLPRHVAVIRVRKDRPHNLLGVASLAQNLGAFCRMLLILRMSLVGPALIVEIVQQRRKSPSLFISALLPGISANASFHRQHMLAQTLRLRVLAKQFPGIIARRHSWPLQKIIAQPRTSDDLKRRPRLHERSEKVARSATG